MLGMSQLLLGRNSRQAPGKALIMTAQSAMNSKTTIPKSFRNVMLRSICQSLDGRYAVGGTGTERDVTMSEEKQYKIILTMVLAVNHFGND